MYSIILADDELSALESMRDNISWNDYEIAVPNIARTGKEALDFIKENHPDIAILDIRMPGFSGLDISKYIFQNNLNTQVIILSGYAEFSYAQKAIQYGVLGYCLKPVEYDEITSLLLKAVRNIKSINLTTNSIDNFLEAIESNDEKKIFDYLTDKKISYPYYIAASINDEPIISSDFFSFSLGKNQYIHIGDKPFNISIFDSSSVKSVGIYPNSVCISELKNCIYKCHAMSFKYFFGTDSKICTKYYEYNVLPFSQTLQDAVAFGEKDKIIYLLQECLSPQNKNLFTIHSAQQLHNIIISNNKLVQNNQDLYLHNYHELIQEFDSFEDMINFLIDLISSSSMNDSIEYNQMSNAYFLKIMKYINTYYKENIGLNDVAKVVNLNSNYISQVFKKTTGTTFSHYITNLRIQNAQKLLEGSNLSINDVATQSGFNDYFYFLKTFKKYTNKTPSEYRNN